MSLYTPPSSEGSAPYVKYNAKSGRWYVKKDGEEIEVQTPTFVADLKNARRAWMHFEKGQAPNVFYFPTIDANTPKPSDKHKLGLSIHLFSPTTFGGVVRMESCSIATCTALGKLYDQYDKANESKQGFLPVVKATGTIGIPSDYGTNYEPVFVIEKWIPRPKEFDEVEGNAAAPVAPAAPVVAASSVSEF
jgi:hypothetical protein